MSDLTNDTNEIVLYQPDSAVRLEVLLRDETVWLTQLQISELFDTARTSVVEHIKHIYDEEELFDEATCRKIRQVRTEGNRQVTRELPHYNLDMVISIGYRVNSKRATQFRQWATGVLRKYMLHGYAVNQRFEHIERRLGDVEGKIDFFVKTALPPVEGIFFEGQIFDAYEFVSKLVKSAKKRIVLIDNYVDETVLSLLAKRDNTVPATIYTARISNVLQTDINRHNAQYPPITVDIATGIHDRFMIIDSDVYHIGASIKDLGKKLFAFSKMGLTPEEILQKL